MLKLLLVVLCLFALRIPWLLFRATFALFRPAFMLVVGAIVGFTLGSGQSGDLDFDLPSVAGLNQEELLDSAKTFADDAQASASTFVSHHAQRVSHYVASVSADFNDSLKAERKRTKNFSEAKTRLFF